jgi:nickel transport protein
LTGIVGLFLVILPATGWTQDTPDEGLQAVTSLVKEQNRKLSGDLRRIQREIAALRADLDKPGVKDVAAGIGYIFGLFGVAAYVASRRKP